MKRLFTPSVGALSVVVLLVLLSACAPQVQVQNNVVPTLFSVTAPEEGSNLVLLQGRYFNDGMNGQADDSYVILGANINGDGGIRVRASSWSSSRITVPLPEGATSGHVFVVVRGVRSNGLPLNLN